MWLREEEEEACCRLTANKEDRLEHRWEGRKEGGKEGTKEKRSNNESEKMEGRRGKVENRC